MKKFIHAHLLKTASIASLAATLTLVGCADHNTPTKEEPAPHSKFGYGGTNSDTAFVANEASPSASPAPDALTNATISNPPSNPFLSSTPQPVAIARDIPYGTPVPGKPGYVISPYSPKAGYVDVHGFPPGTEVKDPYSQKIFLVP